MKRKNNPCKKCAYSEIVGGCVVGLRGCKEPKLPVDPFNEDTGVYHY